MQAGKVQHVMDVVDIYPTVAAVTGVAIPPEVTLDWVNMWRTIVQGKSVGDRILCWRTPHQMALRKGIWKLVHTGEMDQGITELFILADDPEETRNVAQNNSEIITDLMKELKRQVKLGDVQ